MHVTVSADDLRCTKKNREGHYQGAQRTKTGTHSLYTAYMHDNINVYVHILEKMLTKREK
jgi:hypothetical protein